MEQAETKASKHIKVEHMGILTQENQCWKAKYMTEDKGNAHTHTQLIYTEEGRQLDTGAAH